MNPEQALKKIKSLGDVSATLFSPLLYRAAITSRRSFLYDPFSVRLAKKFNIKFAKINLHSWPLGVFRVVGRAYQFDQLLKRFILQNPYGTVINLGAGLDTTFMRVDNGKIHWVDLDFPKVIALRKLLIPKNSRVHLISKSILDLSWMKDIKKYPGPYLFMASGLFMYITEKQTKTILTRLAKQFPDDEIIFDPCTKVEVFQNKMFSNTMLFLGTKNKVIFKWGIKNPKIFTRWSPRIKLISVTPCNYKIKSKYRLSKNESLLESVFGEEVIGLVIHLKFLP